MRGYRTAALTLATATAATAVALGACGHDNPSRHGEIIVASATGNASMSAAITAPLSRVGSCIGLGESLVIWPEGTTWDASTATLTLADGDTVELGEELHTGGGSISPHLLAADSEELAQALTDCKAPPDQDVWVM
ncbi:hypothetical protein [Kineococcus sp. SYSU DK005]|uniref:hypothetical protein n=1 Tax=Kineococcus sp. SYSU DK005 TaxID=3383126 RepID=UPI003D7D7D33